jgi:PAS domain S-box-containing protein
MSNPVAGDEERLRALVVDQMPEAAIVADGGGVIRLWNRGAEALFGFAAAEALGASLDLIIPEKLRAAHDAGFRRALETGRMKLAGRVMTTRATHKDGRRLYVDFSFTLLQGEGGATAGVLAIGRDATVRYLEQRGQRAAPPP